MEKWADRNSMKTNKSKDGDGIIPLLRANMLEDGFAQKELGG